MKATTSSKIGFNPTKLSHFDSNVDDFWVNLFQIEKQATTKSKRKVNQFIREYSIARRAGMFDCKIFDAIPIILAMIFTNQHFINHAIALVVFIYSITGMILHFICFPANLPAKWWSVKIEEVKVVSSK